MALMAECFTFLRGLQSTPPALCCNGLQRLTQMVSAPDDKQLACKCLNRVLPIFRQLQPSALAELPKQCHLKPSFSPGDC
ncbi:hypothetical protein H6P81_019574 [Aristolochia fimbriata]|uniref:Bifunctional inhibitor/plant lipid transfer protein/seed storage helical domain-containing protein n=1 Tax=Aristolochia fimbriata TaxID=158543 RepID=A0AAV7DSZ7_ARIFI|nr:hypothetical protein H6P81_019574 [Aristolochia fimbriata]